MPIRPLSEELSKIAQEELGEVPSRVLEDVQVLRDWAEKQPHLKARVSDQFLVGFLRGCKFSLEKAKQKLDYFYSFKTLAPEFYRNRAVNETILDVHRIGCFARLPKPLNGHGPRIDCSRFGRYDPQKNSLLDILRVNVMISEIQMIEDDNAMISGSFEVVDFAGLTFKHLIQFEPTIIKKSVVWAETTMPFRFKGLHFINVPKEAVAVLNIARSLMSEKLKKRFHIHKNLESLYEVIPREYLPEEYGGTNGSISDIISSWEDKLLEYKAFFDEDSLYGTDESRRTDKKLSADSLFGFDGSFRKLDVD